MRRVYGATWAAVLSGEIASHAVERAAPVRTPRQFPTVVFSHGLGGSGFNYTVLIEELVSRGYVVAAIEHTYSARAVWFPDGRVITVHEPTQAEKSKPGAFAAGINDGAADVRFVIDRLTEKGAPEGPLAGRIDPDRLAAMGHSAGAEFTARACQLDARIHACVDLDGGMVPVAALPLYDDHPTVLSPLLFLEAYHAESTMGGLPHERIAEYYKMREQQLQSCPRGTYAVVLNTPGIAHPSFGDNPVLFAGQNEVPPLETALHNLDLIARFTAEFLGKNLRRERAPLFEGEAPAEAEVVAYGR
jgi:dienelactone hydrolase